jgi:hypothetical protein
MTEPPTGLAETLRRLSEAACGLTDDWWLIGSAALAVRGVELANLADVDVLTTPAGLAHLATRWAIVPTTPGPSDRFRSELFLRWMEAPLPVEVMAGFHVRTAEGWCNVWPASREAVVWQGLTFYTPSRAELLDLLDVFDRPKDRERADQLRMLPETP